MIDTTRACSILTTTIAFTVMTATQAHSADTIASELVCGAPTTMDCPEGNVLAGVGRLDLRTIDVRAINIKVIDWDARTSGPPGFAEVRPRTDAEHEGGRTCWGARTVTDADIYGSEWTYVTVGRIAVFLEASVYDGTEWLVIAPDDAYPWTEITIDVRQLVQEALHHPVIPDLQLQEAVFLKCDVEISGPGDIADIGAVQNPQPTEGQSAEETDDELRTRPPRPLGGRSRRGRGRR